MKKVLLSLSMLAAVMTASAQTSIPVGSGAYDDFTTQTNAGNLTGEYSSQFTYNGTQYSSGIFYWKDSDAANASNYVMKRDNGILTVTCTKNAAYSPIGLGFGDLNGDGTGTPFSIDITTAKTISFKVSGTQQAKSGAVDAFFPSFFIQVSDASGKNGEIKPQVSGVGGDDVKYGQLTLTATPTVYTYKLDGMLAQTDPNAKDGDAAYMWKCKTYPSDCPDYTLASAVDFTKITKVSFFIAGGKAYNGTVTIDEFKIGNTNYVGLGTTSAAANIASSKVFPNPASTSDAGFTAEVTVKNNVTATVILTDMMGKQIATKSVNADGQAHFATSGLAAGMYTVTYVLDGTPAKTELVVVK